MNQSSFTPRNANISTPNAQANAAAILTQVFISFANMPCETETTMRIVVNGGSPIAWCYGNNPNLTFANGVLMLGNTVELFGCPQGVTGISIIAAATGSSVAVILGDGQ